MLKNSLPKLPETPGVYLFSKSSTPIYVGKAVNLKRRVSSYFDLKLEPKTQRMTEEADALSFIRVNSELEALLLEAKLIRKYMPHYNVAAKDDKHPLYIRITKEKYPRVITARKISIAEPNLAFFGPFPSASNVRSVLRMIRRIFPYSDHKPGKRPCLYSHIGLCNPCPNKIENAASKKQYLKNIRHIRAVLSGRFNGVKKELTKEMENLSKEQKYEEASLTRNRLQRLDYITQPQMPTEFYMENPNLYEDMRDKELKDLKAVLGAQHIKRIECFDVAHLAGTNPTASMVTFINAEADKNYYRHFRINQRKKNSDVDSLKEVIKRRLKHLDDWGRPDLMIVDGGKPQVGVFIRELEQAGIPVVGLAKRFETLVIPQKTDGMIKLTEFRLPKGPALNLVQRMRDEAHRFARRYHHKLVSKSFQAK